MEKKTSNYALFRKYIEKVQSLNQDKNIDDIYHSLLNGKNAYMRYHRYESSLFDSSWIDVVEDVLYDLGEIVSNPKSVTAVESNVVPIELAKKIDGESVQHLASHTQYVKDIDAHGDVIPGKILSHSNEDSIFTYENRFIATFIRRLVLFVEKRYEYIEKRGNLHFEEVLYLKNNAIVNGAEVEIETKIKVKKESDDEIALKSKAYVERIKKMREYIFYYYNSPFMRKLKNEKDVKKPILQTNIIRKNLKYNKCYRTFLFIEKFNTLGVNYKVDESYHDFSKAQLADLNYLLLSQYLSIQNKEEYKEIKKTSKTYKPKIVTNIDDEIFTFGEPLTGTLEFVRVDEEYRKYLNDLGDIGLPLRPNKYERLYYAGEYQLRKENKKELLEIEKLLRRKIKENANWEKYVEHVLAIVAIEDREEEKKRLQAIIDEEMAKVEAKRQQIIKAAQADSKVLKEEEKQEKKRRKKQKEETPTEQKPVEEAPQDEVLDNNEPVQETEPETPKRNKPPKRRLFENENNNDSINKESNKNIKPTEEQSSEVLNEKETPVEEKVEEPLTNEVQEEPQQEVATEVQEQLVEEQPIESEPEEKAEKVQQEPAIEEEKQPKRRGRKPKAKEEVAKPVNEEPSSESLVVEEALVEENVEQQEEPSNSELTSEEAQEQPVEEQPRESEVEAEVEEPQQEESVEQPEQEKVEEPEIEESIEEVRDESQEEEKSQDESVEQEQPMEEVQNEENVQEKPVQEQNEEPLKENIENDGNSSSLRKKEKKTPQNKTKKQPKANKDEDLTPIPGRFIVKTLSGYYVSKDVFSDNKEDAFIFDDFNEAQKKKKELGGKIVKL